MSDVRILTAHVIGGIEQRHPLSTIASGPDAPGQCSQTDPEVFAPKHYAHAAPAIAICEPCPFKAECAQIAIAGAGPRDPWGVWAGVYVPLNNRGGNRKLALARLQAIATGEQVAS